MLDAGLHGVEDDGPRRREFQRFSRGDVLGVRSEVGVHRICLSSTTLI